jgi:hypothetical protein
MPKKDEIRAYIPPSLKRLVKAVIGVRFDKDLTLSDAVEEALRDWLAKPENQELIKTHRLNKLEDKADND